MTEKRKDLIQVIRKTPVRTRGGRLLYRVLLKHASGRRVQATLTESQIQLLTREPKMIPVKLPPPNQEQVKKILRRAAERVEKAHSN
jgi:hypothetical protein